MKIRIATQDDIPVMAELLHELFAIETDFTPHFPSQFQGLELLLNQENARVFVAEVDDQVVGMCSIQLLISTAKGAVVGLIDDVVVDVDHHAKGIGSALLRTLEDWARDRGLARLQLQADRANHKALGFYRCKGWHQNNLTGWMKQLGPAD